MRLTKNLSFQNFKKISISKKKFKELRETLYTLLNGDSEIIKSFSKNYHYSFDKQIASTVKKFTEFNLIGMGGSSLGMRSIYYFLSHKIKKKIFFIDDLDLNILKCNRSKVNIIISKSGDTLETIVNSNVIMNKKNLNLFITEEKESFLRKISSKLNSIVINHNQKIGGRYSVMSEVGMFPSMLLDLNLSKFKVLEKIKKNKKFINAIVENTLKTVRIVKKKKFNSIILNYDKLSSDLFYWYQQLIAESLSKNRNGFLPVVSQMPRDNHSLMQLYLDGIKNNFYTFFFVDEKNKKKINSKNLYNNLGYIKNKKIGDIKKCQFLATQNIFTKKKIPYRSFIVHNRNEEALGELFIFFILETILVGKILGVNPFNQPAVELIKSETKKLLLKL